MLNNDCIFCKIVRGEIPCDKIYEDSEVLAFLDIKPSSPGHCLVISKEHYESFLDLPTDLLCSIMKKIQKISKAIISAVNAKSFNLMVNTGKEAGQLVNHVHFHIIPRQKEDNRNFSLNHMPYLDGKKEEIMNKIKKVLK